MPKKSPLDLTRLEELAATGKTQPEIAEALGFKFSTFTLRLKVNKETRQAYDRGRAKVNPESVNKAIQPAQETEPLTDIVETSEPTATVKPEIAENSSDNSENIELTGSDERELIKKAIRAGRNLIASISDFTDLTKLETQKILWEMCEAHEVEWRVVGTLNAWFIKGEVPEGRLFLNGDGGVCSDPKPISEESKSAVVVSSSSALSKERRQQNGHNGNGNGAWREKYVLPKQERIEIPKTKTNRLELLKKVQAELLFYDAYGEFSPRCDSLMQELTEAFQ